MEKKYVPAGVFLACDRGTVPSQLSVTFNANTSIYGQCLATEADKIAGVHVKPMGACAISQGPCVPAPLLWNPVKNDVVVGNHRLLLEDSKLQCQVGGRASIFFSLADAQAACPAAPPEKSMLDKADDYLATLGPAGDYARFQMGMAEGLYGGGKSMVEGLWGLAKGGWHAATHPVATAQAVGHAASAAADWASKGENWSNAASAAGNGIDSAADWASHGENWGKAWAGASAWASRQSPRDWGKIGGRATFEVALAVGTAGAGEAVNAAGKVGEAANLVEKGAEAANLTEKGLEAANLAEKAGELGNAAGKAEVVGKVTTGAEEGAEAARAAAKAEEAAAAEKAAQELETVEGAAKNKRTCEKDPIDVTTGAMLFDAVDIELPGPVPFAWERTWYSTSRRAGPLGHGWHHCYDLALWQAPGGIICMRLADGRLATFPPLSAENNFCAYHRGEKLELQAAANGKNGYTVRNTREQLLYHFTSANVVLTPNKYVLQVIENAHGQGIHFGYDTNGWLLAIEDSAHRLITVKTDVNGRIQALELPHPDGGESRFTVVQYNYDATGNLITIIDAEGHAAHLSYQTHLLTTKQLRGGGHVYFEYDNQQRCIRTWCDENYFNGRFFYTEGHTLILSEEPDTHQEYFHHHGLVTRHVDPVGAMREWYHNAYGEAESERDPLGHVTTYDYDSRGLLIQTNYPNGVSEQTSYDALDRPVGSTDPMGGQWQWHYGEAGHLLARIDPTGARTSYTYGTNGRVIGVTDALNQVTNLRYDAHGNLTQVIAPDGSIRSGTHDWLGRPLTYTDATGRVESRRYDLLGQLTDVIAPDGTVQHFVYTADGQVKQGFSKGQQIDYAYSPVGQLMHRAQNGRQLAFQYNREGNLVQVRNEQGNDYFFDLNEAGQVVKETGFDGLSRRYERDEAGRVTTIHRPAGATTTYSYDAVGRVLEAAYSGTERTSYRYRADGLLAAATTGATVVTLERDALGRVVQETQNGLVVQNTYDALGRRIGLQSSLGASIVLERDVLGHVHKTTAGIWQSRIMRDAEGLELHRQLSSIQVGWQRDGLGRPTGQRINAKGSLERQRQYCWQKADQLTALNDSLSGTSQFTYDAWGSLSGATYPDDQTDLNPHNTTSNPFRPSAHTGQAGQVHEADGTRYKYDEEGHLTKKIMSDGRVWRYAWDGAGQLAHVTRPDGYAVAFEYDGLGRRISKRFRGRITRWVWDGDKPLHEWHELEVGPTNSSIENLTTWLFDEESFAPAAKLTAQNTYSIVCDHLGTPLTMYDMQGKATWDMVLDRYGAVRQGKGRPQDCPFRYQGQYEDFETGLYYNRFRYYDPQAGQYISPDPLGLWGGFNLYAYVGNTLSWIDPLGLTGTPGLVRYPPTKVTPVAGGRATAINRAWTQERQLVTETGAGTRTWTPAELDLIKSTPNADLLSVMSEHGYTGHHINSVKGNGALGTAWKGDPRNIVFLENAEHAAGADVHLHGMEGHRGAYTNPGKGRLIDRQAMIDQHRKSLIQSGAACPGV